MSCVDRNSSEKADCLFSIVSTSWMNGPLLRLLSNDPQRGPHRPIAFPSLILRARHAHRGFYDFPQRMAARNIHAELKGSRCVVCRGVDCGSHAITIEGSMRWENAVKTIPANPVAR